MPRKLANRKEKPSPRNSGKAIRTLYRTGGDKASRFVSISSDIGADGLILGFADNQERQSIRRNEMLNNKNSGMCEFGGEHDWVGVSGAKSSNWTENTTADKKEWTLVECSKCSQVKWIRNRDED